MGNIAYIKEKTAHPIVVNEQLNRINKEFFYNQLIIEQDFQAGSWIISDGRKDKGGNYIDYFPIYVTAERIEIPHRHCGEFMWYVEWVMAKELAIFYRKKCIWDEGVGRIKLEDMHTHEACEELEVLKRRIGQVKNWGYGFGVILRFFNQERLVKFFEVYKYRNKNEKSV